MHKPNLKTENLTIRLPKDLKKAVCEAAAADDRSINKFIERALREAVGAFVPRAVDEILDLKKRRRWKPDTLR